MQLLLAGAEQLEAEGAAEVARELRNDAERILRRLGVGKTPAGLELEPPDLDTLMAWETEGGCEAACADRCWTEPDGTCPHGNPSWLLKLGYI